MWCAYVCLYGLHVVTMYYCIYLHLQEYGYTPLHLAAKGGHTACVEHLLSTPGIDVNIKDMVSYTVVH